MATSKTEIITWLLDNVSFEANGQLPIRPLYDNYLTFCASKNIPCPTTQECVSKIITKIHSGISVDVRKGVYVNAAIRNKTPTFPDTVTLPEYCTAREEDGILKCFIPTIHIVNTKALNIEIRVALNEYDPSIKVLVGGSLVDVSMYGISTDISIHQLNTLITALSMLLPLCSGVDPTDVEPLEHDEYVVQYWSQVNDEHNSFERLISKQCQRLLPINNTSGVCVRCRKYVIYNKTPDTVVHPAPTVTTDQDADDGSDEDDFYPCGVCEHECVAEPKSVPDWSIGCDACLKWFHYRCVHLTGTESFLGRKSSKWFCPECKEDGKGPAKKMRKD